MSSTNKCITPVESKVKFDEIDLEYLRRRDISVALALKEGLRSLSDLEIKIGYAQYGFRKGLPCGGLLFTYRHTPDGNPVYRIRLRGSGSRSLEDGDAVESKKLTKFLATAGAEVLPYFTCLVSQDSWADPTIDYYIVEGPAKAITLSGHGLHAIGLGGVEAGFHDVVEAHTTGNHILNTALSRINWTGRRVYLCSDANRCRNPSVARGEARLARILREAGAIVHLIQLPWANAASSQYHATEASLSEVFFDPQDQGPDDFVFRHGFDEFQELITASVPANPLDWAKAVKPEDVESLLKHLPFQAALHVGETIVQDLVFSELKKFKVRRATLDDAVRNFRMKVASKITSKSPTWTGNLTKTRMGTIAGTVGNVAMILERDERWAGVLAFNEFTYRQVFLKPPPFAGENCPTIGRELVDLDDCRLVHWLEVEYGMIVMEAIARSVMPMICAKKTFHPVRAYLNRLKWDGTARLAGEVGWLTTYCGAKDSLYTREIGKRYLIQAVARIFRPGCKADTMLTLVGDEGINKSTLFEVIGNAPGGSYFADDIGDIHHKDALGNLCGKWVIEFPELSSQYRSEIEYWKKFSCIKVDNYRPPYGHRNQDYVRQCIFGGTTNDDVFLKGETGNRRYWPVWVSYIKIAELKRDVDQLLAEAVELLQAGHRWWIDPKEDADLHKEANAAQERARVPHPWEDTIRAGIEGSQYTTVNSILETILNLDTDRIDQKHQNQVAKILKLLGWHLEFLKINDRTTRIYVPAGTTVVDGVLTNRSGEMVRIDSGSDSEAATAGSDTCGAKPLFQSDIGMGVDTEDFGDILWRV